MARVLITGARRGIGLDVAQRLVQRGHEVWATAHADEPLAAMREALGAGAKVHVEKLDITDATDRVKAAGWDIDVLINNAAIGDSGPLLEIDVDRIRRVFETNLHATLELTQVVCRDMIGRGKNDGRARVVLIGSMAGLIPTPFLAPYAMTKFAMESLAYCLRAELKPFGIHVCQVNPGAYGTGFNQENIDRKYDFVGPGSLYQPHLKKIRRAEGGILNFEVNDTAGIARQIVRAVEATRPRRRYVAPWWQWLGVPFARLTG
jgi:short-subunit dehydrogenase